LANAWELYWKTELEVRSIILNKIFEYGWNWESFNSIVAFGKNSSIPHHATSETIIWTWPLLIDMWALYKWYCSDFTRTIWIWDKSSKDYEEFQKIYKIVKDAHLYAFENARENMIWKELHALANSVIKSRGYEDNFIHWTGHWIGLDIHEKPFINKNSEDLIKNNMIFTIEPGIYFEWKFWIRLEDIVIMGNGKLIKYSKVDL
jgi:Xaa-Pro aminopeptidase